MISSDPWQWDRVVSPTGRFAAWHEFDAGVMPWDDSRIVVEDLRSGQRRTVDVEVTKSSVTQPRFSPGGDRLAFLCDAAGWSNVWVAEADGSKAARLIAEEAEHGGPAWSEGQRSFAWAPDGAAVAFDRNEGGFGRLVVADATTGAVRAEIGRGVHKGLTWPGDWLGSVRSGARTPPQWLATRPTDGDRRVLFAEPPELPGLVGLDPTSLPEPEVVWWPAADGIEVPGRLYRAIDGNGGLVVWIHGGPTGQSRVEWSSRYASFLAAGWSLLVPDHRGSTGWGREWAQAMNGRWGELDVTDCAAAVDVAAERGWVAQGGPVVAGGSSAGGFTALNLLAARPDALSGVVAVYPVVDMALMRERTSPFEARYADVLVGPAQAERDMARSPLGAAGALAKSGRPVMLLHGTADEICPPEHSRRLAAAVTAAGGVVDLHEYPGEGHGWRLPGTADDERSRTIGFLDGLVGIRAG